MQETNQTSAGLSSKWANANPVPADPKISFGEKISRTAGRLFEAWERATTKNIFVLVLSALLCIGAVIAAGSFVIIAIIAIVNYHLGTHAIAIVLTSAILYIARQIQKEY